MAKTCENCENRLSARSAKIEKKLENTKMKEQEKTIRRLKAKHLPANVLPSGDYDHRKIRCNQIQVDKTYLNELLDAVWEAAYSKGSHDMAEQAADDIQYAN